MKIIIMQGHQTGNMTTHTPNVMDTISTLTEAVQSIVNRDKIITSMLLTLPEHQTLIDENAKLKEEIASLQNSKEDGDSVKITIHEKNSDNVPTLSANDIREQYGVQAQNILKDVKTVTAKLGSITLDSLDNNDSDGNIKKHINDFSQKLYELVDSVDTSNDIYSDIHAIADEFETTFKPWLVSAIPKQSLINLLPVPRTTDYKIDLNDQGDEDEDMSDDDDVSEEEEEEDEEDDAEEEDEEDDAEEDDDDEDDAEEHDNEDDAEEEPETSVDNVDAVANKWDEKEHNRVIQGDKDEEEEDLSEEEEDDGTTNTSEEEQEEEEEEEEEEEVEEEEVETSSEELVVCEMEDEDGNALEYLTNDPEEMNGDIFELLDGDEVGKKIGRFVDGEPEFFD